MFKTLACLHDTKPSGDYAYIDEDAIQQFISNFAEIIEDLAGGGVFFFACQMCNICETRLFFLEGEGGMAAKEGTVASRIV
jgi:hypothetical protein